MADRTIQANGSLVGSPPVVTVGHPIALRQALVPVTIMGLVPLRESHPCVEHRTTRWSVKAAPMVRRAMNRWGQGTAQHGGSSIFRNAPAHPTLLVDVAGLAGESRLDVSATLPPAVGKRWTESEQLCNKAKDAIKFLRLRDLTRGSKTCE